MPEVGRIRQRWQALRLVERGLYVVLIVGLNLGYGLTWVLTKVAPMLPKPRDRALAIYLFNPENSDGHYRRYRAFESYFEADGIDVHLFHSFDESVVKPALSGERSERYVLYLRMYWKRLLQVLQARHFEQVLIQRNLFPDYPDKVTPHLERLLRELCDDVSVDFWDPIYLWDSEVTNAALAYVDRVICDNSRLAEYFTERVPADALHIWPIAMDTTLHPPKTEYRLHEPARLFYTGSFWNVRKNLDPLIPVLERLHESHPIELVMVGLRAPTAATTFPVHHHAWGADTYYELMRSSDIGLFPFFEKAREENWARVAGKTLDYMASALPFIGVTEGLAEGIDLDRHVQAVVSNTDQEWLEKMQELLDDQHRREELGRSARTFIEEYCPVDAMYLRLREILSS